MMNKANDTTSKDTLPKEGTDKPDVGSYKTDTDSNITEDKSLIIEYDHQEIKNSNIDTFSEQSSQLEQLIYYQTLSDKISENYKILGVHLCILCCEQIYDSKNCEPSNDDIYIHVQSHFKKSDFNEMLELVGSFVCDTCNQKFYTSMELLDHIEIHINEDNFNITQNVVHYQNNEIIDYIDDFGDDLDDVNHNYDEEEEEEDYDDDDDDDNTEEDNDNDNEEIDYAYRCPVCENGYANQITLGNHFMLRHNNFTERTILDQKKSDGFPGFEVLNKIGMIRFIRENEKKNDPICVICCNHYDNCMQSKTDDVTINKKTRNKKYRNFIDDTKLLYLYNIDQTIRHPVELLCCKAKFCSTCLRDHINSRFGDPECPFCKKNHVDEDKRFIIFDERPKSKIEQDPDPYKKIINYSKKLVFSDNDDNEENEENEENEDNEENEENEENNENYDYNDYETDSVYFETSDLIDIINMESLNKAIKESLNNH